MAKKPYWKYKTKILFEGYKLIDDWHASKCPDGPGHLCGFPENFMNKIMNKVKKLLAENKKLKEENKKYKEILETKDIYYKY